MTGDYAVLLMSGGTLYAHDIRIADVVMTGNNFALEIAGADTTWEDVTVEDNAVGNCLFEADGGGSFTMSHTVFRDNTGFELNLAGVDVELHNSLFYSNSGGASSLLVALSPDASNTVWAYNNVWYDNSVRTAVDVGSYSVNFDNNILYANSGYALSGSTSDLDYNDAYSNGYGDFGSWTTGTGNISEDPAFNDAAAADFTLDSGFSLCVDAGNPLSGYNDVDGTRNDMGGYGGPEGSGW